MKTSVDANIKAGTFVGLILVAFALGIFLLGKERHIFTESETYFANFQDVGGLSEGAPVRLGGITVGRVSSLEFTSDPLDASISVSFEVEREYLDRIRGNSIVRIETQGLLGDKFISIAAGPEVSSEPVLEPGSKLNSQPPADFFQVITKAQQVVDNTVKISESINAVLDEVRTKTINDFSEGVSSFKKITQAIEKGDGLVHRLFYSKKDADNIMDSVAKASKTVDQLLADVKTGDGLLHTLIYDPAGKDFVTSVSAAAAGLSTTSENISAIAEEIRTGQGVLHELVYQEGVDIGAKINESITHFEEAASALEAASKALADGNGTIGALLVDPTIYDNLVEITDGAKKSALLRYAIRASLDK